MSLPTISIPEVGRPTGLCAATGRTLQPGEPFVGVLAEDVTTEAVQRFDFGASAWTAGARPPAPWRVVAHWRSIVRISDAPRRMLADDDELLDILDQSEREQDPAQTAFRYLLALILIRRRRLRLEGSRSLGDGRAVLLVRRKDDRPTPSGEYAGPPTEITDPGMDREAMSAGMRLLDRIMAGSENR